MVSKSKVSPQSLSGLNGSRTSDLELLDMSLLSVEFHRTCFGKVTIIFMEAPRHDGGFVTLYITLLAWSATMLRCCVIQIWF